MHTYIPTVSYSEVKMNRRTSVLNLRGTIGTLACMLVTRAWQVITFPDGHHDFST